MRIRTLVAVAGSVWLALALTANSAALAQARDFSRVRVLAVAPFADENPLSRPLAESGAARLSVLLRGGRLQVIDAARTSAQMKSLGVQATELISPSRTVALGASLGADAVLTGRVIQIQQEINRERADGTVAFSIEGRAVVDMRILEVETRLILWQEEMACSVPSIASAAMECLVRQVAARVAALSTGRN